MPVPLQARKKPAQEVLAGGPGQQLLQATCRVAEVQQQLDHARASAAASARCSLRPQGPWHAEAFGVAANPSLDRLHRDGHGVMHAMHPSTVLL